MQLMFIEFISILSSPYFCPIIQDWKNRVIKNVKKSFQIKSLPFFTFSYDTEVCLICFFFKCIYMLDK